MSYFILEDDFIEPSLLYIPEHNSFKELFPSIEYSIDKREFIDELICPICLDILDKPISCNTCECMICEKCYNHIESQNVCPCCNNFFIIKKIQRQIINILYNTQYSCPECNSILKYNEFNDHSKICFCKIYKCLTENCNFTGTLNLMKQHILKCGLSIIKCDLCNKEVKKVFLKEHIEQCENEFIPCIYCYENIKRKYMEQHFLICPQFQIKCDNCGLFILRKNLNEHKMSTLCLKTQVENLTKDIIEEKNKRVKAENDALDEKNKRIEIERELNLLKGNINNGELSHLNESVFSSIHNRNEYEDIESQIMENDINLNSEINNIDIENNSMNIYFSNIHNSEENNINNNNNNHNNEIENDVRLIDY